MENKAIYTIGFFTVGSTFDQSEILAKFVNKAAEAYHVNLVTFLGGVLSTNSTYAQYNYQRQCNVVFEFANSHHLDGIILASHLLAAHQGTGTFAEFYRSFMPMPMVSLGLALPDVPSVYIDNTSNFNKIVSHLIENHGRRKIAFLSGPSSNTDAFNRYLGYTMALEEHNISYRPDFVHIGDFTEESAIEAVHTFFDERHLDLDAIVCSNDTLALTVMRELQKRDILIPEEIMVTGYGNISNSAFSFPSLTTIEQSLEELANESMRLLIHLLDGGIPNSIIVPSHLIFRRSCDCHLIDSYHSTSSPYFGSTHKDAKILAEEFIKRKSKALSNEIIESLRDFIVESYQLVLTNSISTKSPQVKTEQFFKAVRPYFNSATIIFNLKDYISILKSNLLEFSISSSTTRYIDEVYDRIIYELVNYWIDFNMVRMERLEQNFSLTQEFLLTLTQYLGNFKKQIYAALPALMNSAAVMSYMVYLYKDGIKYQAGDVWSMPHELLFYVGYVNGEVVKGEDLQTSSSFRTLPPDQILTYGFENHFKRYSTYVHTISIDQEQLGVMVFQIDLSKYSLIDSLAVELACALKLTFTFSTQRQLENKLETLSQTDELTHLFNRRGFLNLARERFKFSRFDEETGLLFYADMDGLKKINDTYGHTEGDFAIISMAHILQDTFLKPDIVGRIGGDEFVILSTDQDRSYIDYVTMRLNQLCNEFNASSGKPYLISISIGGVAYGPDDNHTLETLLTKADELLYDRKQRKKMRQLTERKGQNFELL